MVFLALLLTLRLTEGKEETEFTRSYWEDLGKKKAKEGRGNFKRANNDFSLKQRQRRRWMNNAGAWKRKVIRFTVLLLYICENIGASY